ncbi:MAG: type II toxin-antitoxin system HicA family toxin [Candidatus Bipolaricaulota bacterium]|nr:type II toxin-antitoxin system HicA family toxin [Candidatus Bipolaricaulota bacterium]
MTPGKTPRITAAEMRRAIERAGFTLARQSGSHLILRNEAGRRVTLPLHARRILHPKVVHAILRDAELTVDDLLGLL